MSRQQDDPNATLNSVRALLAFRRQHPALFDGDLNLVDVGDDLLGFTRQKGDETLLCVFNLTGQTQHASLPVEVTSDRPWPTSPPPGTAAR